MNLYVLEGGKGGTRSSRSLEKKEINKLSLVPFFWKHLRKIKQFIESLPIQRSIYQHSPKRSLLEWPWRFPSSDRTGSAWSWRQDLSCASSWGAATGALVLPHSCLQDFVTAFLLGMSYLTARSRGTWLICDQGDKDLVTWWGVGEAELEPAALVVVLGRWAVWGIRLGRVSLHRYL